MFDNILVIVCLLVIAAASALQLYLNWASVRRMRKDSAQMVKDLFGGNKD